tara:strand:- start:1618 stop:1896 length:279 start_codon:yes stop_codon:yes gene_type:complete
MPRFSQIGTEETKQFTAEQEKERDAEEQAFEDRKPAKKMFGIRTKRDQLLVETDWMANGDVTMSDSWKTYRKALRDVPAQADMDNITWPTKP